MALSCLKARFMRGTEQRAQRLTRCVVRAQAGTSSTGTAVSFKIHRHVQYGQSLLLVGSAPELGSWDAKQALELQWGEGDNWTTSAALPVGASVEYKYIVKRKEGLDWCPGQNKSVTLPSAVSVEVMDSWDSPHSNVTLLQPLEVAPAAVEAAALAEEEAVPALEAVAPAPAPALVAEAPLPGEGNGVPSEELLVMAADNGAAPEAFTAVNTVENLHVPELEQLGAPAEPAIPGAQHQQPPAAGAGAGFAANNIVQGVPLGAIAVGQDPITQYEEADKYQVVEVGASSEKTAAAVGASAARIASSASASSKALDKMTMAELRTEVKRRGMSPLGNRRELLTRLQNAGVV
ncbi:hypothetical protein PLESTB_000961400 [Pleodorina starrii]|uniref:CBM20 domain-containing protein n=1 Tax=Pleodorina starrii TaxID=330485 RepID=A0A9W6BNH1_9CHLO|nr:hypothetical protein PLESTM_001136700 [Pleodorina starrii]GLC55223.1 hypothetical protein PLESTB_000961400 [Pleodorina starrii]GLC71020.1 hypothetical protein PLESTF_001061600 [Pleodorina starrii]